MPHSLRIVFMGTPEFSVPTLRCLLESPHTVVAVYTQPPRPSGRGHKIQESPVHLLAKEKNIPVFTPKTLRNVEEQERFKALNPDVCIVIAYGLILPKPILETPVKGCLNVHASLLPRWRGAAPIQRSVLAGDAETGVTIMCMDEGLDTGDMLKTASIPITKETTTLSLQNEMAFMGAQLLVSTLNEYVSGVCLPIPQPKEGVTYASKLTKEEGIVDWSQPADFIERQVRALNPWPGATFFHEDNPLKILQAEVIPYEGDCSPGTVLDDQITIACKNNALRVLTLQKSGSKALSADAFLRGYDLPKGTLLCPVID